MATSALIAYVNKSGNVIACNTGSDGYLSWTGQKLFDHYKTYDLVESLILPGDIYQVRDTLQEITNFSFTVLKETHYQNLDKFLASKSAYGRTPGVYLNGYLHVYLFMDDQWFYHKDNELHPLSNFVVTVKPVTPWWKKVWNWINQ